MVEVSERPDPLQDVLAVLSGIPRPAENADETDSRQTRLRAYFVGLDTASREPTATALWAASFAAMDLSSAYSFYGWTQYGCATDSRGLELMRQAVALKAAAERVDPSMAWLSLPPAS